MIILSEDSVRLKFIKDQADSYSIYDKSECIGYMYCTNYYSATPNRRRWDIRIDTFSPMYYDGVSIGTLASAKQETYSIYADAKEKQRRYELSLENDGVIE